jgi:hypothetical protein
MTGEFSIQQTIEVQGNVGSVQMTVPVDSVGIFRWRAHYGKIRAEGYIRVTGLYVTGAGGHPGTEYWYISKPADIPLADTFIVQALCISKKYSNDFIPKRQGAVTHPVVLKARELDIKPGCAHLAFTYTGALANPKVEGMAALAIRTTATPPTVWPLWFWRPNPQPGLFGHRQVAANDLVTMTRLDAGDPDFPQSYEDDSLKWKVALPSAETSKLYPCINLL